MDRNRSLSEIRFKQWRSSPLLFSLPQFLRSSPRQLWPNLFHKQVPPPAQHRFSIVCFHLWSSGSCVDYSLIFKGEGPCVSWLSFILAWRRCRRALYWPYADFFQFLAIAMWVFSFNRYCSSDLRVFFFFRPSRMEVLWTYFCRTWWNVCIPSSHQYWGYSF